jgi:hypothetical protein
MQELETLKFDRNLTSLERFENLLFKKRIKGQEICKDQLPALRRLWPMVLTEIREEKKRSWWQRFRMWFVRITRSTW